MMLNKPELQEKPNYDDMALNLFRDHNVDRNFKRMAIVLCFKAIQENPKSSERTLNWILGKYNIKAQDVDAAIAALKNVFKVVDCFNMSNKLHYVAKAEMSPEFSKWLESTLKNNPELVHYDTKKAHGKRKAKA